MGLQRPRSLMAPRCRSSAVCATPIARKDTAPGIVSACCWRAGPISFWHWLALNALGVSIVPISRDLRATELEYIIAHSRPRGDCRDRVRPRMGCLLPRGGGGALPVVGPTAEPPALNNLRRHRGAPGRRSECALLYTSGTTGNPKGCVLPNEYFLYAGHWYASAGGLHRPQVRQRADAHAASVLSI